MRHLIFPIDKSLDGPWLLSSKSLKELDAIVAEYWNKFESRRIKLLRDETNEFKKKYAHIEKQYRKGIDKQIREHKEQSLLSKSSKVLFIYLQDAATYSCESFDVAFRERKLVDKNPIGFGIEILSGDIGFHMNAILPSSRLEFSAEPEGVLEAQELYTSVYEWAMELRRHVIGQWIWGKIANQSGKILSVGVLFYLILFGATQNTGLSSTKEQLSKLYEQGITNSNVVEAVRLLVLLQKKAEIIITPWLITYPIILAYLATVLYVRPKVVLGIGRGRDALLIWGLWQWVALVPPVFFLGNILRPYITELVKKLLFIIH